MFVLLVARKRELDLFWCFVYFGLDALMFVRFRCFVLVLCSFFVWWFDFKVFWLFYRFGWNLIIYIISLFNSIVSSSIFCICWYY